MNLLDFSMAVVVSGPGNLQLAKNRSVEQAEVWADFTEQIFPAISCEKCAREH